MKYAAIGTAIGIILAAAPAAGDEALSIMMQRRVADGGAVRVVGELAAWDPAETAVIVCDMWDKHWCRGATARVAEMAPAMDKVLRKARGMGVLIIHAPSSTMDFYKDTPQRKKAQNATKAQAPSKHGWRHLDKLREGPLPIDDSDGGCNCRPPCPDVNKNVWTRQIAALSIGPDDAISDSGQEVFNLLEAEGRKNVILMGVHTNMCVLGRPFAIRAQVRNGMNVALMRDLTDTMYNAQMPPKVDHHRGTDLVIAHIEQHWCPTMTSSVFTGKAPFRFNSDKRPHAVFLLHEQEYETARTVPLFAEAELAGKRQWRCTYLFGAQRNNLPGLEALADADLMFVSVRRQILPEAQLARIRGYCERGGPVVGIRTASHAFAPRGVFGVPKGHAAWPEFDPEILGGHYEGHHNNKEPGDPKTFIWGLPEAAGHPIMRGVSGQERSTRAWLYKVLPLSGAAEPLMMGRVGERRPHEPVAWTNTGKYGNRVFYTSLGHPDEFADADFLRLLVNGILWAVGEGE